MKPFTKIENKSNGDIQSIPSCNSNGAAGRNKEQNLDYLCLPVNFETEKLSLIDLTVDECSSPVQEQVPTENLTNTQNKISTSTRKNVNISKANINSIYSLTSAPDPSKAQLKQTQLNSFFGSAKIINFASNNHSQLFIKDDDAPNKCESSEKDTKCYSNSFMCLNVKMNKIEEHLDLELMEKQMHKTNDCDKGLLIGNNQQNHANDQKEQTMFVKQEIVDLCLDSSSENRDTEVAGLRTLKIEVPKTVRRKTLTKRKYKNSTERNRKNKPLVATLPDLKVENISSKISSKEKVILREKVATTPNNKNFRVRTELPESVQLKKIKINNDGLSLSYTSDHSNDIKTAKESIPKNKRPGAVESEKNECPPYKVIEGTTFAVDAFNYGLLKNVTAYFLTHFHTDHYIGLTKKFRMPIYASKITINLIRGFISVDEKLLNILFLDTTVEIEGVHVTAIDANHCPGAIMLLFQLPCGKRILHTGDFRWSPKMELDPQLNQKHIDLIYLDTTHILDKHIISSQEKCISKAIHWVREFKKINENKKVLFVVCTDVIGKENFWLSIAEAFDLKVWSDGKRRKALSIIGNEDILKKLVTNPNEAHLHVVSHAEAGYKQLDEYFRKFSDSYDMILSIKPKGSDSIDPEFVGPVNSVSIRYSEHSTHKELRRFLGFLLPTRVISTVPLGTNIFRCPKIPVSWHTKELFVPYKKQASLLNYLSTKKT